MKNYPKYRIKAILNEDYEYVFQPQIKETLLLPWANIVVTIANDKSKPLVLNDIISYYFSNNQYSVQRCKNEEDAKIIIKHVHLALVEDKKKRIAAKNKKKVVIINVNPEEL